MEMVERQVSEQVGREHSLFVGFFVRVQ